MSDGNSPMVAVLRKGQHIATVKTAETDESKLTKMMVGRKVSLNIDRPEPVNPQPRLTIAGLTCRDSEGIVKLDNVGFIAYSGEILGIAGIAGSGQKELLETIAGLETCDRRLHYLHAGGQSAGGAGRQNADGDQGRGRRARLRTGGSSRHGTGRRHGHDRQHALRSWNKGKGIFIDRKAPEQLAEQVLENLEVKTPDIDYPVRKLSGGNVQKVLVGREIASAPSVLMSAYAVRGLDIHTSYTIYNLMTEQKQKGVAVIFVGEDLDVLLELCDKIPRPLRRSGFRHRGRGTTSKEEIGL